MMCKNNLEIIKELVSISQDIKVWCLTEKKFLFTPKIKTYGRLNIIDLFNGNEPYLLNQEFFQQEKVCIRFLPTFVLDSNVVGTLHNIINDYKVNEADKNSLYSFIDSLIIKEDYRIYDINPIFYILESILKNVPESYIIDSLASVVLLQSFNYKEFKLNNKLIKDESLKEEYIKQYGTYDLKEVAKKMFNSISQSKIHINNFKQSVDLTYLFLLKIAQINIYEIDKTPLQKINLVKEFYMKRIGIFGAREFNIAVYYFHNKIGSFIPTKKQNANEILKLIYNSALDISLLRISETMLSDGNKNLTAIVYPVTFEQHVAKVGHQLTISTVMSINKKQSYSIFLTKLSLIEDAKDLKTIIDESHNFSEKDFLERFEKQKNYNFENIEHLIQDTKISILQAKA